MTDQRSADALEVCRKLRYELGEIRQTIERQTIELELAFDDSDTLFSLGAHLQSAQAYVDELGSLLAD